MRGFADRERSLACLVLVLVGFVAQGPSPNRPETAQIDDTATLSQRLQALVGDIFRALKTKDDAKTLSYMKDLIIPDHDKWFKDTFGEEGARLEAQYAALLSDPREDLRKTFEYPLKSNRIVPSVKVLEPAKDNVSGLEGAILSDMAQPTPMYEVDGKNPKDPYPIQLGYFFFVGGAFRFVDSRVFWKLSNAPVMRIRMGGNVRAQQLIKRVQPDYPEEAKEKGVTGTVRLHIVTTTDGTVKELSVISGDPILAKAAMEAVRQWKYKPVSLNGKPVEVDSTVDVVFAM